MKENLPDQQLKNYYQQLSPNMSKESLQEEGSRTKDDMQEVLMGK